MEHNIKILPPEELIPPLLELMEETVAVPLVITGSSMTPFLVHGRDTVYLSKITRPPQKGDMILYRRNDGSFVLHRVYKAGPTCTMVGDAQVLLEHGIRPDQMLARVSAVCRNGKQLQKGSFCWDFFEIVWIRLLKARPALRAVASKLKKLLH